jgi:hypothetical protein
MLNEIRDPIDRIRAATGRVKSVRRDARTFDRIAGRYELYSEFNLDDVEGKFKDAKQEAAKVVVGTIRELQASGIDHSVEIVEAITDARYRCPRW